MAMPRSGCARAGKSLFHVPLLRACCTVQGVDLHLTDTCPSWTKVKEQRIERLGCSNDDVSCIMQALSAVPLSLSATGRPWHPGRQLQQNDLLSTNVSGLTPLNRVNMPHM